MLYPDLAAEGLVGHKVNDVFVTFGARKNYYVDITDTIELKIEALNKHVSQVGGSSLDEMIRQWAAEAGKQVGFDYAEGFYRITLRPMETPGVLQPES